MTDDHVSPPQPCVDCLSIIHMLAEAGPPQDHVIKRCEHGAAGDVVAVAAKNNGKITTWILHGPLSKPQAEKLGEEILRKYREAGMSDHTPTRQ